ASREPEGLEGFEDGVKRYYRGLRSELRRLLEEDAGDTELAAAVGKLGLWFHVHLNYRDAVEAYALAEALDPSDAAWPYRLGHAARSLGDSTAAAAAWARTLERRPDYLPARIQLAELALAQGDLDNATAHLQAASELAGDHPRVLVGRGEVALQQGDDDGALRLFTAAAEARPESRRARYGLGLAYRELGRMREAQQQLTAAQGSDKDPFLGLDDPLLAAVGKSDTSSMKLWRQGRAALADGRPEAAARWFEEALQEAPDRVDYRVDLGTALAQAGRTDEAADAYRQALSRDPGHDGARIGLATLYTRDRRYAEAETEYRTVLEQHPRHPAAHLHLAHLLRLRQDLAGAGDHYEIALEIDPRNESARFWRAWTLHLRGDSRAALAALEDDLALLPRRPMLLSLKARLGSRAGATPAEIAAAQEIAARLFERSPNAFYAETLAMTLAASGRSQDAVRHQQSALEAARAAGIADTSAMDARLADYRAGRPAASLLAPADMDAVGVKLGN
ncbi:MAG: tetratricopeptide repeat protein, partial [Thermoanaerobaculia bacterium]